MPSSRRNPSSCRAARRRSAREKRWINSSAGGGLLYSGHTRRSAASVSVAAGLLCSYPGCILKDDLQPPSGSRYEGVAAVPNVSLEAVPIQQHDLPDDGPPSGMSGQPATSLFDDGDGVSPGRSPDIQMHVQACVLTYVSEELCEGAVARTLDANEDDAPRFYRAPPHPHLNRSSERRRAHPRGTWGRGGRRDAGHGHPGLRARGSRHHGSSRQ